MTLNYLVKEWMTPDPITITSDTTLDEAYELIIKNPIRRLPVVDDDQLKGIVTWGDVREARPSDATSVSIFEIHHMLSRTSVSKIMTFDPYTVSPDDSIGKAAHLMHKHRITCLPVVEDDTLVGIITTSDILRVVIKVCGYEEID